jgi:glycosyltransferase involved in cell wall biosynthesis
MMPVDRQQARLSVGLVSPGWPARAMANGIVSYVATIARALEEMGVACEVLTPQLLEETGEARPRVHRIATNDRSLIGKVMWRIDPKGWPHRVIAKDLLRKVTRLHAEGALDLLEVEESFGWPRHLAGRCPVPMVVRLHGPWFLNGLANGAARDAAFGQRDNWERAGILAASAITAPSRHVLEATRSHYALPLAGAEVIPNPVEPVAEKDRWNLQQCDRNRVVFIGRFDRHKGGDTMIDAFAHVLKSFPEARLDFVGPDRGCRDDAGREWRIEQYLREKLSEADRSKVTVHGFLPGLAAAELRKRALVTVAPSRYETFGIAAAEAMMAGCPLLVCAAGALTELVQNGQNGRTAAAGDARDVGEKLMSLLKDPEQAARLGRQAAIDAAERYSPDVVARQTIDFYRRVLGRTQPANAGLNQVSASVSA